MKPSIRRAILSLVGTSLGMYLMVAPLAATASANPIEHPPAQVQTQNQNQKHHRISKDNLAKCAKACHSRHQNDKICKQNPVEVVKSCASELGFDVNNDTFTFVSQNQSTAVVQVVHDENSYNVTLTRSDSGCWVVSTMS